MKIKYQCELCRETFDTEGEAVECEAQGDPRDSMPLSGVKMEISNRHRNQLENHENE